MRPVRVLIADDNKDYTSIFIELLSFARDIEVTGVAKNGARTLEMISETNPDLLLLDIVMPDMDGIEVLRRVRDMKKRPVVFVVSALGNDQLY